MSTTSPTPLRATTAPAGYLPTLDGWRAVAILLVVLDHVLNHTLSHQAQARLHVPPVIGLHGVNLFFGLSGLLITSRLLEEWRARGEISLRGFYVRRSFRILPPALAVLAAIGLLGLAGRLPVDSAELKGALFFYRNYLPSVVDAQGTGFFTSHYWSLAVEEHFYLVWPALLALSLRRGSGRALAAAVVFAVGMALWRQVELAHEITTYGRVLPNFFVRTDTRLDALLWGATAALLLERPAVREWAARRATGFVWLALAGLYAAIWAHFGTQPTVWEGIIVALLIAVTVVRPSSAIGRALELAPVRWVGRLSYSLYLTNGLFLPFIWVPRTLGPLQSFPLNALAVVAVAVALHYLVERPAIRLGHRLAAPVTPGRYEAAPALSAAAPDRLAA
jgi:peptidoglycan/LPS O-acetylase OafA/YrhL